MKFVLTGFRQSGNIRHYSFQGVGDDRRTRTQLGVAVDLTLLHKLRLPLQELPLLCCLFLAARVDNEPPGHSIPIGRDFVFCEADILAYAEQLAREKAGSQTDRKLRPLLPANAQSSAVPILIDAPNGRSGIGLGSRAGLPLI